MGKSSNGRLTLYFCRVVRNGNEVIEAKVNDWSGAESCVEWPSHQQSADEENTDYYHPGASQLSQQRVKRLAGTEDKGTPLMIRDLCLRVDAQTMVGCGPGRRGTGAQQVGPGQAGECQTADAEDLAAIDAVTQPNASTKERKHRLILAHSLPLCSSA
jgi:hypothetical protein